jgi:hypothetical protein
MGLKATSMTRGGNRGVGWTLIGISGGGARVGALVPAKRGAGGEEEVVVGRW